MHKPSHSIFRHLPYQCWIFLICKKLGFVFFQIQPFIYELDYHVFILEELEVNQTTLSRSYWHWSMSFIHGANIISKISWFMTISVMPQNLEGWQLCHNMFCEWQVTYLDEVRHRQSWRGHMRSFWKISPFFMEQATCALIYFSKSIQSSCAQPPPCPKGKKKKKNHPNWASYVKNIGF